MKTPALVPDESRVVARESAERIRDRAVTSDLIHPRPMLGQGSSTPPST